MTATPDRPSRREFLLSGGAAVLGVALVGCGGGGDDTPSGQGRAPTEGATADTATTLTAADFDGLGTCRLAAEQTEGPFYLDADLVRRDITEGLQGHPLRLGLRVVDESCQPLSGAVVDIWHTDVDGDYSAYTDGGSDDDAGEGTTFLRGSQVANGEGIVEFVTNYPGWYRGRTVHIHAKVHLDAAAVLTTQLYFPDDLSDEVFGAGRYAEHGSQDTYNADDSIAGEPAADGTLLTTRAEGSGTLGLLVVGAAS